MSSEQNIQQDFIKNEDQQQRRSYLGQNQDVRIFLFQAIGTCILTFGILCSIYVPPLKDKIPNPFHEISISVSLYLAIVLTAPFCGGHYNPAVTCAMFFKKDSKITKKKLGIYILAQYLGVTLGIIFAYTIYQCELIPYQHTISIFRLLKHGIGEFAGGFLFIFLILTVTGDDTTFIYETAWVHIFIPVSLFAARSLSFFIGGINPAIVIGLQIQAIILKGFNPLTFLQAVFIQLLCIVGSIIAVIFYQKIYKQAFIKYQ